uniref:Uncharacterized protein n=1 Tax=uncultured prokaryote TaxID=198431 RepID=A0A0H5Q5D3_9ZZZZ|nr:hypothetical protein [uncultured prokaryote]
MCLRGTAPPVRISGSTHRRAPLEDCPDNPPRYDELRRNSTTIHGKAHEAMSNYELLS